MQHQLVEIARAHHDRNERNHQEQACGTGKHARQMVFAAVWPERETLNPAEEDDLGDQNRRYHLEGEVVGRGRLVGAAQGSQQFMALTVVAVLVVIGYFWYSAGVPAGITSALTAADPARPVQPGAQAQPAASPTIPVPKRPSAPGVKWVKNHRITEIWSGPGGQSGVTSFGKMSAQFCAFLMSGRSEGGRQYVYTPVSHNYFWIDGDAIGEVPPPPVSTGPRPTDKNCADTDFPD
jgi:hypothetical protein